VSFLAAHPAAWAFVSGIYLLTGRRRRAASS